jgi:hypothetical protein
MRGKFSLEGCKIKISTFSFSVYIFVMPCCEVGRKINFRFASFCEKHRLILKILTETSLHEAWLFR